MIPAAELRHRVTLRKPDGETTNAVGESNLSFTTYGGAIPARVRQMGAQELTRNGFSVPTRAYAIRIRAGSLHNVDVQTLDAWRVRLESTGRELDIRSAVLFENREGIDIVAVDNSDPREQAPNPLEAVQP